MWLHVPSLSINGLVKASILMLPQCISGKAADTKCKCKLVDIENAAS